MASHFYRFIIPVFCSISSLAMAGVIPEGYPVDRYSSLWKHSPFTIASVQQEIVPAGFATKLALVGIARIGSEDIVTLLNKESQARIILSSKTNDQDLKLVSVEQDDDPMKMSVTVQMGSEVGKVKFDPSLLTTLAPQNPPGNQPPQGMPPSGGQGGQQNIPPGQFTAPPPLLRVRRSLPIPSPYQVPPPNGVTNPAPPNIPVNPPPQH